MASRIRLSLACGPYDIVQPLITGEVEVDGVELTILTDMGSRERHWRFATRQEFDICEQNIAGFHMARDKGFPYTSIPVFLHRRFRHGFIFINRQKGSVKIPADLVGKKIGGNSFAPAGNVWIRGILADHYGVSHKDILWVTERDENLDLAETRGLRMERTRPGQKVDTMLVEGEIDAIISPGFPKPYLDGDPRIARLFPDNEVEEIRYYKETGIFPIMHATAIREDIVKKYPWVPGNLVAAFQKAKELAYQRIANPRMVPLAFVRNTFERQVEILGEDPWEYGLSAANRKNLETIARYSYEQGMTSRHLTLDELYLNTDEDEIITDTTY